MNSGQKVGIGIGEADNNEMTRRYGRKSAITNVEVERQILDNGYGVKSYKYYSINPETGEKTLLYTDKFIVNSKGERVKYTKQGDEKWGSIEINNQPGKYIRNKGCVIVADSIYYEYMGYEGADPKFVPQLGVNLNAFTGANFTGRQTVARRITKNRSYTYYRVDDSDIFKSIINERIERGLPIILRYGNSSGGHSVVVCGYRIDAQNQIISYHISDPGYANSILTTSIRASDMAYLRKPKYRLQNIQWYE